MADSDNLRSEIEELQEAVEQLGLMAELMDETAELPDTVAALMGQVRDDLAQLVAYPSLAFPGYDPAPLAECGEVVRQMFEDLGFPHTELLDVGGPNPTVWAERPGEPGGPTVLLYAHYDVQPAPVEEQRWVTDPWALTTGDDGRWYGRGAADDKGGIVQHLNAIRAIGGVEALGDVTLKVCIEGDEEYGGPLPEYVLANPDRFAADLYLIADLGNLEVGEPVVVTQLRGFVKTTVRVSTLEGPLHSGMFGGAAPDAFIAAARLISSCFDDEGNVVVEGLVQRPWDGAPYPEEMYREQAGMLPGVERIGSDSVASHLWSRPSITVLASDLPPLERTANILIPNVTFELGTRITPFQTPESAAEAVRNHLLSHTPWGAKVDIVSEDLAPGFHTPWEGDLARLVSIAIGMAYGKEVGFAGTGGSIPLLSSLQAVSPTGLVAPWGPEDQAKSRVHGGNESIDPGELERCILAEAIILKRLAGGAADQADGQPNDEWTLEVINNL